MLCPSYRNCSSSFRTGGAGLLGGLLIADAVDDAFDGDDGGDW